jgi:hypothetical protein
MPDLRSTGACDQAIYADFVDGRLVYLSYEVAPSSVGEVIVALKGKFGEPSESANGTFTWRNSVGYLMVMNITAPGPNGSVKYLATSITSSLNDRGQGKDIGLQEHPFSIHKPQGTPRAS